MKLDLAVFVSSKKAASLSISSAGKTYDIVLSVRSDEGKDVTMVAEVYRTSTDSGVTRRKPSAHATRSFSTTKERVDFFKAMGVQDEGWEPEEDGRA